MDMLTEGNIYSSNGNTKRERENFRNFIFSNLTIDDDSQFSFYRSDFRGAHFSECKLTNVLFDMADFIDTVFINSHFNRVEWGSSEIKNCYFNNVYFKNNIYNSSIQKSIYQNCHFSNEKFKASAYDVSFIDCSFNDCDFEGTTFEDIKFSNTIFNNCEMSTMHAENFNFEKCSLNNVVWGIEYWFTYFIYRSKFNGIKFKYRGKYVNINQDKELFSEILFDLRKRKKFFEYLNIGILSQIMSGCELLSIEKQISDYHNAFTELLCIEDDIHRKSQISNIFRLIDYYFFRDNFNLFDTMRILDLINNLDLTKLKTAEALNYRAQIFRLNEIFTNCPFEYTQIVNLPYEYKISANISLDFDEKDEAEAFIKKAFELLAQILGIQDETPYIITKMKKGSWQIELISSAVFIIMLLKIIKSSINFTLDTYLRIKLSSYLLDGLDDESTKKIKYPVNKLQKSVKLLQSTGMLSKLSGNTNIFSTEDLLKFLKMTVSLKQRSSDLLE